MYDFEAEYRRIFETPLEEFIPYPSQKKAPRKKNTMER